MKCSICSEKAVINRFCEKHFIQWFENKVIETINAFNMIRPGESIAVAASGGKDSKALLYVLSKYYNKHYNRNKNKDNRNKNKEHENNENSICNHTKFNKPNKIAAARIVAIAIDEGIRGYRDVLLKDLRTFTNNLGIELRVYSFKKEFGKPLDEIVKAVSFRNHGLKPCSVCGVFRRYLLNKHSKEFHKIATAHNLDDEVQSIIMNIFTGNKQLMPRIGPITTKQPGMVQRIKPFYFIKEKHIAAYSFLNKLTPSFKECPYSYGYRSQVSRLINRLELLNPNFKENIVRAFLKLKKSLPKQRFENYCKTCGEPSSSDICKSCQFVERFIKRGL